MCVETLLTLAANEPTEGNMAFACTLRFKGQWQQTKRQKILNVMWKMRLGGKVRRRAVYDEHNGESLLISLANGMGTRNS